MITSQQAAQAEMDLSKFRVECVCRLVASIVGNEDGTRNYYDAGTAAHNAWCLLNKWKQFERQQQEFRRMLDTYDERAGR